MEAQELIDWRAVSEDSDILEIYNDEVPEVIYEELIIPEPITSFITDIDCNCFVLPNSLSIFDADSTINGLPIFFNIPPNLTHIVIRNKDIWNKRLLELFNPNFTYRYINCTLDGVDLSICVNQLYKKYFNSEPRYPTNKLANQKLMNNILYSKVHRQITDSLVTYEQNIQRNKQFCSYIKEELISKLYHPDRIEKLINTYGIDILDEL